jgi:hypothetical protein
MGVTRLPKYAHRVVSVQIFAGKFAIHFVDIDLRKVCCPGDFVTVSTPFARVTLRSGR